MPSRPRTMTGVAKRLAEQCDELSFGDPVTHVYNPLRYAWKPHARYLEKFGKAGAKVKDLLAGAA